MSNIPSLTLNTTASMPLLGLGVYKATAPGEVEGAIATALDLGYRLIDTASAYKNEEGVGRGIRSSSVPREELSHNHHFKWWFVVDPIRVLCLHA